MSEIVSAAWWESKLVLRLDFVAVVAAIVIVCRVALEEDLGWVAGVIAGVAVVFLTVSRWPYGALLVLIATSAMPRFFTEFFGWKARPEHFAVVIVSSAAVVWFLLHKRQVRFEKIDYWILAYLAINYISSAFGSSEPSATLRWALQNNLAVLPYFLIRFLVRDLETLGKAFRILLGVGIAESIYGILCYASQHAFGTTAGMEIGQYFVDIAAPYGSLYEPNLFGAYTACCAVLFLALYLAERKHHFSYLIGFLTASLAAVLSFSRAALFALIIVSGLVFWRARNRQNGHRSKVATLILAYGLASAIAATAIGGVLQERFANLFYQGFAEETAISRFLIIQEALQDVPRHPLLGTGTASFNLSFDWTRYIPEWASDKTWIGNAPLRILHDTGLIGLTTVLGFLVSVWWKIRRCLRAQNDQFSMILGLAAGALLYCISFQSTDGTILAFSWVHLGFLASAAILTNNPSHNLSGIQSVPNGAG